MKKARKLLALLLATLMLVAMFAGCAQTEPAADDTPADTTPSTSTPTEDKTPADETPDEPTSDAAWDTSKDDEIIVSVINGYYTAGEKKLAEEYMKLHPETKVTIDVIADNNSYNTKMTTVLTDVNAAGTSDIVHINFLQSVGGGYNTLFDQGIIFDLSTILDIDHPYQDGTIRDMYDAQTITEVINSSGGTDTIAFLPFDKCGVSFYYNKDMFAANGLTAPETWEDLLAACETFRNAGVETPVAVSSEASWILASLADAGMRANEYDYLVHPEDGLYNASTMSANDGFAFDESNLACDAFTIFSGERGAMARMNDLILSDVSRTVWSEFVKLARYFPQNYVEGGSDSVTNFEMQYSPIMVTGSWNVGLVIDDLAQMPVDAQFDWATFNIPSFANPPEGFASKMRGLYTFGNCMGIITKDDADHNARVLDFYLYWYSQAGSQLCYEETLSNGNYVQGPAMIKGVTLSDALMEKLSGFIVEGAVKGDFSNLIGQTQHTEADRPLYNDNLNKFIDGDIDLDTFITELNEIAKRYTEEMIIEPAGYDLDPATNP